MKDVLGHKESYIKAKWNACTIGLTVAVVILAISFIILLAVSIAFWTKTTEVEIVELVEEEISNVTEICRSKACVKTAATLIDAMDFSTDPCNDFFKFSCGNYIATHPVPDHKLSTTTFDQYEEFYNRQLRDMIESINVLGETDVFKRAQEAYHVCLNTNIRPLQDVVEREAFKTFVRETMGGWPLAIGSSWKPRWTKEKFLGILFRLGFPIGFRFEVVDDFKNPMKKRIWFSHSMERDAYRLNVDNNLNNDDAFTKAYTRFRKNLIRTVAGQEDFKVDEKELLWAARINQIVNQYNIEAMDREEEEKEKEDTPLTFFDYGDVDDEDDFDYDKEEEEHKEDYAEVAENKPDEEDENKKHAMTIGKLMRLTNKEINWLKVLNIMFEDVRTFSMSDIIYADIKYVKRISSLVATTKYRAIVNAFILKIVEKLAENGGPQIESFLLDFRKATKSQDEYKEEKRWEHCISWIQDAYRFPITRLFVDKYIDPDVRRKIKEMIKLVKNAYKEMIDTSLWLDPETKIKAQKKADMMKVHVNYPDFIFNDLELEDYYDYVPSVQQTHFVNYIEHQINKTMKTLRSFKRPTAVFEWTFNPLTTNAFYNARGNSIWFPVGLLQLPYFELTRPTVVNFGMIGSIIGHEMGHVFDNNGRRFDEIGRKENWWSKDILKEYKKRSSCIVKQYNNYCPKELQADNIDKVCVNGSRTLGQNLADLTGLRAALLAYKRWEEIHGDEIRLPGLDEYTAEQIFFISYAYKHCENVPPSNWQALYEKSTHASPYYRVIGVLANMVEFSNAFSCPIGRMNRARKICTLW